MDVRLSEEQLLLQETAQRLAAAHGVVSVAVLPPDDRAADKVWAALAELGLLALRIPEADGGMGASAVEAALVAEQLAAAVCIAPFTGQGVVAPALLLAAGAGEVDASAAGQLRWTVGLTPDLDTLAAPGGDFVAWDALGATHALLVDRDGALWAQPVGAGAGASTPAGLDLTRRLTPQPALDAQRIGTGTIAAGELRRIEALAMSIVAAGMVGTMQHALDLAVEYAGQRTQFGRRIGSFQALQHLLADAAVLVESSRSTMWHAAWAVDALEPDRAVLAARHAKAYCGAAARKVVEIAVQAFGGVAITWEHLAHVLLRRVLADDVSFGNVGRQHREIATARLAPGFDAFAEKVRDGALVTGLDFFDSADEAAFRSELRAWLAANRPVLESGRSGDDYMEASHEWHQSLARGGYVGLSFPVEYGGRGRTALHDAILNDELGAAGLPPAPAINHITNAIRLFGTEEQKREILPGMLSCTVRWCQGFSEPNAGSDLASISTRAESFVDDGGRDAYRINGQKIWTSEAVWAQWCLLLARTEADQPAHRGLSMLLVPMDTPGIDCRPIVTAYGSREFAEVFFDDVVVPAANLLGRPGQGWEIAMALLGFERGPSDMGWTARLEKQLTDLEASVRDGATAVTEAQRESLAEAWVSLETLKIHVQRTTSQRLDGSSPGPEGSIDKLLMTNADQLLAHVVLDIMGASAVLDADATFPGYVWSRAQSIFGGTQQVQRTIVAQRVLGLPRE